MAANDKGRPLTDRDVRPKRKAAPQNPIEAAVISWLASLPPLNTAANAPGISSTQYEHHTALLAQAPKRWTVYEPMVLLPTGSLSSPAWRRLLANLVQQDPGLVDDLWQRILASISRKTGAKQPLTHLAVNEGIPLVRNQGQHEQHEQQEQPPDNVLRSPTGLLMLHGDFGPSLGSGADCDSSGQAIPTDDDFDKAFWVSTKQNGICQTWAPRWTMFSRGNIKEKARLLDFHKPKEGSYPSKSTHPAAKNEGNLASTHDNTIAAAAAADVTSAKLSTCYAVDMYAGIGYFVFSYARLGLRVLCWEINPWSVEGLRRGAEANGWSLRVVRDVQQLARPTPELVSRMSHQDGRGHHRGAHRGRHCRGEEGEAGAGAAQIVVFLEDNRHAARRIAELREAWQSEETRQTADKIALDVPEVRDEKAPPPAAAAAAEEQPSLEVLHVNAGLLPASNGSWPGAWDVTSTSRDAWLHLHENVGVADIERRKAEIEQWFQEYQSQGQEQQHQQSSGRGGRDVLLLRRTARVEHVELVKTFAPDVWHCVFDVYVTSRVTDEL
ncbi:tRNA wybutosine-synthesizing protein 2 [Microdochium nivale]|nr:tRNA wybutosine-synthesizing protein 2 [Microdochium nivale]